MLEASNDNPTLAQVVKSVMNKPKNDDMPIADRDPSLAIPPRTFERTSSTPSTRTGPPRPLDYIASGASHQNFNALENGDSANLVDRQSNDAPKDPYRDKFYRADSDFRGALEYADPDQREKEREAMEKKERSKRRENRLDHDTWKPRKWLHGLEDSASPKEERQDPFSHLRSFEHATTGESRQATLSQSESPAQSPKLPTPGTMKWSRLKSLLPQITATSPVEHHVPSSPVGKSVNITDELITGGLSAQILRMWFERDERGARCIPVLLHRLRIRVSDSLHPLHGTKAVFRIECEYANGAARWVIYRQLRDFLSLHAHYRVSKAYNRNIDALPKFPQTSLPYFKFLKKQHRDKGKDELGRPEFARLQREALENYLVGLVRAVMFHPTSNRLSRFLEISALFIQLAQSGGYQAKAGVLQIEAVSGPKGAFARKSLGSQEKKKPKWCAVRDSYLVVLEDPGNLDVFEVFMLDSAFNIEFPKRVYRQGLHLLHVDGGDDEFEIPTHKNVVEHSPGGEGGTLRSVRRALSQLLHPHKHDHIGSTHSAVTPRHDRMRSDTASVSSPSASSRASSEEVDRDHPMVDPSTNMDPLHADTGSQDELEPPQGNDDEQEQENANKKKRRSKDVSRHTFFIENSQMRLKLFAKNTRQMQQWIAALERTGAASHWVGKNRFDSFAPIRLNVAAQWLVDGRDYFWNLSRAILLAKDTIYIHDWWISPELQMRRPGSPNYRLDRLLERKAKEGVKIFIIVYQEVSSRTTPTDSSYTKRKLTALHENIMIQRSPSHFQTGTFYWAHHEKMCVIDEAMAFMGGLDLCFGRWDTAQHVLVDDGDVAGPQGSEFLWPGKDYSNERVLEFHTLNKPEQDMYDRTKVPRMPWHDVALQIVGQPARDLCRHFVQRWNYLLRNKNHTRFMPFLLPPPEFKFHELTDHGLTGTCKVEHSIQNAYLKAIQLSEHFVYIENQFFISSTSVNDVQIENKIGDALVNRIIRAHGEGTKWKAVILIPLLPGFPSSIDQGDASAIRIILECQNRTMSRGDHSIFKRLQNAGINPDEYITFFSLRGWGKLRGDILTTEQVYVHSKTLIVDDRLAIIGSANINERSQHGDRDSELASVVRDTDMIDGKMDGRPYKVGRFAHTLRVRLMREHLGVDVDAMYEEDLISTEPVNPDEQDPESTETNFTQPECSHQHRGKSAIPRVSEDQATTGDATSRDAGQEMRNAGIKPRDLDSTAHDEVPQEERHGFRTIQENIIKERRPPVSQGNSRPSLDETPERVNHNPNSQDNAGAGFIPDGDAVEPRVLDRSKEISSTPADGSKDPRTDEQPPHAKHRKDDVHEEDTTARNRSILRKRSSARAKNKRWKLSTPNPKVDPHGFEDPICDEFLENVWTACAAHNTEIYRKVFHAIPDDAVTTWKQYKEFTSHHERLQRPAKGCDLLAEPIARIPPEAGSYAVGEDNQIREPTEKINGGGNQERFDRGSTRTPSTTKGSDQPEPRIRRPSRVDEPLEQWERDEMEALLMEVKGHLVLYPTRFLESEAAANNFLFNADRLLPLPIYT